MKKLLKSRRGIALEMAITLIMVTFALSTLILTVAMLQHTEQQAAERELEETILLEQMGEDFCRSVIDGTGTGWVNAYPEEYTIEINDLTLTVMEKESGELLMTVELASASEGYTIVKWKK